MRRVYHPIDCNIVYIMYQDNREAVIWGCWASPLSLGPRASGSSSRLRLSPGPVELTSVILQIFASDCLLSGLTLLFWYSVRSVSRNVLIKRILSVPNAMLCSEVPWSKLGMGRLSTLHPNVNNATASCQNVGIAIPLCPWDLRSLARSARYSI